MFRERKNSSPYPFSGRLLIILLLFIIFFISASEVYSQALEYRNFLFWTRLRDVDIEGDYAFCAFHNGLAIFDISDPDSITSVGRFDFQMETQYLMVDGNYVFLTGPTQGLQIVEITNIGNPELVYSQIDTFRTNGLYVNDDYCFLAKRPSVHGDSYVEIIDVSDPANPIHSSNLELGISAPVLVFVEGDYLFMTVGGGDIGTLNIADISDPFNPFLVGYCNTPHDIAAIYVEGYYAYLATYSSFGSEFDIIDWTNPSAPYIIGSIPTGWDPSFADVCVCDNYAYVTLPYVGLGVINIQDKQDPYIDTILGVSGDIYRLDVQDGIAFTGGYYEGLYTIDVNDPLNPVIRGSYPTYNTTISVCAIDDYLYSASRNKILIADNTDRINPVLVNTFDANDNIWRFYKSGNYLFAIQYIYMNYKLHIYNLADPVQPAHIGEYSPPSSPTDVFISEDYAYVSTNDTGLRIIDISNPWNPTEIGAYVGYSNIGNVYVQGNYAYLTNSNVGLILVNVSDPTFPFYMGEYHPGYGWYYDVVVDSEYAYLTSPQGLTILNISDPINIYQISISPLPHFGYRLSLAGDYLYIANQIDGLFICDISNLSNPVIIAEYDTPGRIHDYDILENYVYIADEFSLVILYFDQQTGILDPHDIVPPSLSLPRNHPNPFNASTTIEFTLPEESDMRLSIYNILGQKIAVLFDGQKPAGEHSVAWNAGDVPSGVYFARLVKADFSKSIKMILLK
jgi:hypothetical protein